MLWVGEERLPAHRALLACRSRTFRRLLTSKWLPHVRCQAPKPATSLGTCSVFPWSWPHARDTDGSCRNSGGCFVNGKRSACCGGRSPLPCFPVDT